MPKYQKSSIEILATVRTSALIIESQERYKVIGPKII